MNDNLYCLYQYKSVSDSSSRISHPSVEKFMEYAKEEFDFVIIDTPPVCFTSDFEGLLKHGDTACVVVRQDWASIGAINDVADIIVSHKKNFAGFVLNLFKPDIHTSLNNYDYHNKYNHYGNSYKKTEVKSSEGAQS